MVFLGVFVVVLLALFAVVLGLCEAVIRFNDEDDRPTESLAFTKQVVVSVYAVALSLIFIAFNIHIWLVVLLSLLLVIGLTLVIQLLGKGIGKTAFATKLVSTLKPLIKSINLFFTPLSLPTEVTEEYEQELIESVEELGETIAREIMVPRIDMVTISAEETLAASMTVFFRYGFSRLPVIGKNMDDIKGVLYIKDVARLIHENPERARNIRAVDIAREANFVPESLPVDDLLQQMQGSSIHITMIVDEYGGVAGMVTMEDVIEEIVGNISDEYDNDTPELTELEDGWTRVSTRVSLFDLGEHFDLELEDEDVDSVGGLLAKELGRLPARNDQIEFSGLIIKVDRVEGRRKRAVTVLVKMSEELIAARAALEIEEE
ncbi:MAG: HlyC/CorC family transporter [Micrococcales bacterium]|nr:HlyC/CorC family transporter [Micrococcales bacterium]NBR54479.1 HlyC/CorC family transporter [Micrococcales bacterium]NBT48197.1 HlyC/CorC family transporter [Actinomycetota bacterium]NBY43719.1 HlyC/CorC family transporter [Micrococcales bacterium]